MKTKKHESLRSDCEELLQRGVAEEAVAEVEQRFESALATLDNESRDLIREYFNGTPAVALAGARAISEIEVSEWVKRIKRQILNELRNHSKVRH